jgi:hypothetical protein
MQVGVCGYHCIHTKIDVFYMLDHLNPQDTWPFDFITWAFYCLQWTLRAQTLVCGPQTNSIPCILWLVMNASWFHIIPSLISHFDHGHLIISQSIESFGWDLISRVYNSRMKLGDYMRLGPSPRPLKGVFSRGACFKVPLQLLKILRCSNFLNTTCTYTRWGCAN